MKKLVLGLALSLTIAGFNVNTAQAAGCLFGEQTSDFDTEDGVPAVLARFKTLGIRIQKADSIQASDVLDEVTDDAIDLMISEELGSERRNKEKRKAYWNDFFESDGYVQYFTKKNGEVVYISVASYPGDNEYGAIFKLIPFEDGLYSLEKVADIGDSFIENCRVR